MSSGFFPKYLHLHTTATKDNSTRIIKLNIYPFTEAHPPPITPSLINPLKNGVVGIVWESHLIGRGIAERGQEYPQIKKSG